MPEATVVQITAVMNAPTAMGMAQRPIFHHHEADRSL
jgi:hypothetical protein